jgi:3-phenylpropionate/trans-cinnamate dioxygenase ferredoxin subunit
MLPTLAAAKIEFWIPDSVQSCPNSVEFGYKRIAITNQMADFEKVATVDEIPPGGRKSIVVDETPALLIRAGDNFYAIDDVCTHDGQAMTNGPIHGVEITCPRHGARFDIRTGQPLCMPATEPIATYEVQVREGAVYVKPRV